MMTFLLKVTHLFLEVTFLSVCTNESRPLCVEEI